MVKGEALNEWRRYGFLPVAAALGYSCSVIHVYSIGPFFEPLQAEFGWSRAQVAIGLTVASIVSALFCIPLGALVDRVGPRRVALAGVLLITAAFAAIGTATGTTANWLLLWTIIALAGLGVQAPVWTSAVATRFSASRGLAFAITLCGASISAAVFPLLATRLIDAFDWRTAFMALAAIWAVIVFPVLLFGFRGARDHGKTATVALAENSPPLSGLTFSEGLRSSALYKLLLAGGFFSFTAIAALVHFVPILKGAGATPLAAAGMASLIGIFSIVGRLATGLLLDRFPGHHVGALVFLLPIAMAVLLLTSGGHPVSQAIAAAALGFTVGSEVDVIAFLASKHFGLRSFGALYGALVAALTLGTAFGPLTAGIVFDHYGSYQPFLLAAMVLMAISALALLSLGAAPKALATTPHSH